MRRLMASFVAVSLALAVSAAPAAADTTAYDTSGIYTFSMVVDRGTQHVDAAGVRWVEGWVAKYRTWDDLYGQGVTRLVAHFTLDRDGNGALGGVATTRYRTGATFRGPWNVTIQAFAWSGTFAGRGVGATEGVQQRLALRGTRNKVSYSGSVYRPGSDGLVRLLTPERGALIPQNDPSSGCPDVGTYGRGSVIVFDWTDSPLGINRFELFVERRGATYPLFDQVVIGSGHRLVTCGFVADVNLEDWHWRVRSIAATGWPDAVGVWSRWRSFAFEPCRLSEGDPCHPSSG
jgi:hypothetical protein